MKKLLALVAVLLVAVLMVLTVPDKKAQKEAMMEAVKEYVDDEAQERGFADNGITRIGKGIVNKMVEAAISTKLKVDNYYLFNTTHVRLKGKDKVLSVGMFGHVFTFDKKMLREALEEGQDEAEEKREAKQLLKEAKKLKKEELKAQRKAEKQARKEQKRREKEQRKAEKARQKEQKQ